jgi:hypothetical protein
LATSTPTGLAIVSITAAPDAITLRQPSPRVSRRDDAAPEMNDSRAVAPESMTAWIGRRRRSSGIR